MLFERDLEVFGVFEAKRGVGASLGVLVCSLDVCSQIKGIEKN